jgi:hypothetical protein
MSEPQVAKGIVYKKLMFKSEPILNIFGWAFLIAGFSWHFFMMPHAFPEWPAWQTRILLVTMWLIAFPIVILINNVIMKEFKRLRFIVADDCIQLVERFHGKDSIVVHIPYGNIDTVFLEWFAHKDCTGIDLVDPLEPGTYHRDTDFREIRRVFGCHFELRGYYQCGQRAIKRKIVERLEMSLSGC